MTEEIERQERVDARIRRGLLATSAVFSAPVIRELDEQIRQKDINEGIERRRISTQTRPRQTNNNMQDRNSRRRSSISQFFLKYLPGKPATPEEIERQERVDARIRRGLLATSAVFSAPVIRELDEQIRQKDINEGIERRRISTQTRPRQTNNNMQDRNSQGRGKSRLEILLERQKQVERQRQVDEEGVAIKRGVYTPSNTKTQPKQTGISDIKINLSGNLELSDTVFSGFVGDKDILIYSFNKFYNVIDQTDDEEVENYFLDYKGKKLKIRESENLKNLESKFLERNMSSIKNFQIRNLDKFSEEYDELREKILALKDSINKDFSIEEFISDYIFALYQGKKIANSLDYEDINLPKENLTEKTEFEEIDFSDMKNSVLEELVDEVSYKHNKRLGGLIIVGDAICGFFPIGENKQINFDNAFYLDSVNNFNKKYKEKISEKIKKRIKQGFNSEILKINESREALRKLDNRGKKNINNRHGDIGFDKISNNEYVVFRKLPDYILGFKEKEKEEWYYYLFPEVNVSTRIFKQGNYLSFSTEGSVYKTPLYYHPFVWDNNKKTQNICYGKEKPEKTVGIKKTDYNIKTINKKEFAISVLRILDETEKVLIEGSYKGTIPVHKFDYENHVFDYEKIEEKKIGEEEAERLSMRGIKVHYIDKKP